MTESQKVALRLSEIRKRMAELGAVEQPTEEQSKEISELRTEYGTLETRAQALLVAEGGEVEETTEETGEDAEARELRELIGAADVGEIFAATVEHRATDGQAAELQQHFSLAANMIPLELVRDPEVEQRAVTPAPTDTGASQRPIVQPVFATGDAAYLGVDMPTVPVGDAVFPVLTSRPTVGGPHKDSTEVAETTGEFSSEVLEPQRLQASFFYRRTDAARFAMMGEALRQALNSGLSEALDKETIDQIVSDVEQTAAAAADTFASYRERLVYDNIDGRFATMESEIKLLVGGPTLKDMAGLYRGNNADDSAVDSIRRISGGLRVSPHIAAVASHKQDVLARLGMRPDAVAPLWQGVQLIPDEITKAKSGEIVITAVLLAAFKVIRTDGFKRVQAQHQ